ncbi:hypothetical protein M2404_003832 [Rheinheimera pacifica]|uniref:hypothetical protein n=1 Tax=Rheinheimera pacifica TaxID=173990 RepID=UPI0021679728|nr:hypothetical protein [Rheinheimera pacifica]MCS4309460.1 hypothetical protein [Rheinheimera pacifica]
MIFINTLSVEQLIGNAGKIYHFTGDGIWGEYMPAEEALKLIRDNGLFTVPAGRRALALGHELMIIGDDGTQYPLKIKLIDVVVDASLFVITSRVAGDDDDTTEIIEAGGLFEAMDAMNTLLLDGADRSRETINTYAANLEDAIFLRTVVQPQDAAA